MNDCLDALRSARVYASDRLRWPIVAAIAAWADGQDFLLPDVPDYAGGPAAAAVGFGAVFDMLSAVRAGTAGAANATQRGERARAMIHVLTAPDAWSTNEATP